MTWPVGPMRARIRVISWPEKEVMVQDWQQWQMVVAKLVRMRRPEDVWVTSGWNWMP